MSADHFILATGLLTSQFRVRSIILMLLLLLIQMANMSNLSLCHYCGHLFPFWCDIARIRVGTVAGRRRRRSTRPSHGSGHAVQSVGASRSRSGLRSYSTSSMDYSLTRLSTKFGERAFSHAGPATWNALPDHIRTVADSAKFRKLLKSHYFSQAFNIC